MSNILVALFAYAIDKIFGEFRFIKHPIILMGELISFFENRFYSNSVIRGLFLVMFVLVCVSLISLITVYIFSVFGATIELILSSLLASMFLAHNMLYMAVKDVLNSSDKKKSIAMLVSRDTQQMSDSDIYKAGIETYGENLSDGVIAPLFYLLIFGLPGIMIYKAINTMDSMVGYRNEKYENFGKAAAILDDVANLIPSRITAVLIMLFSREKNIFSFYEYGSKHESPNAGHPITAMALFLDVKLGGDTYYFGKLKHKPYFGIGRDEIYSDDLLKSLSIKPKIDLLILVSLSLLYLLIG